MRSSLVVLCDALFGVGVAVELLETDDVTLEIPAKRCLLTKNCPCGGESAGLRLKTCAILS